MNTRILVVEDESTLRKVIAEVLREDGHEVLEAASAEEGMRLFLEEPFPLVITDIVLGKMSGIEMLQQVKDMSPESLVVIMTSHASMDTAIESLRSGAYDFLIKPFEDIALIQAVVNRAVAQIDLLNSNKDLMKRLEQKASELESLNTLLINEANRDGVTGLYNHRYFREALEIELSRAAGSKGTFSLLFLDVDNFKNFNEEHGHLAGDMALKSIANSLNRESRSSTVVARYGGEQFILMVPEVEIDGAMICAERLCSAIAGRPITDESGSPMGHLTLSAGAASFPAHGTDTNSLLHAVDRALIRAKRQGNGQACPAIGIESDQRASNG